MKYLKFTLFMFVVCLIMSYTNTQAREVLGVKAYGLETSLGEYRTKKEDFTTHTYENVGTVKLYGSGEYTNILVKICNKAGKCTKYKEFSTNKNTDRYKWNFAPSLSPAQKAISQTTKVR